MNWSFMNLVDIIWSVTNVVCNERSLFLVPYFELSFMNRSVCLILDKNCQWQEVKKASPVNDVFQLLQRMHIYRPALFE